MTTETVAIDVKGMTCGGCVASVSRVLKGIPGVAEAQVTLAPGRATVTYDPSKTNVGALRGAIEDAGYDVAG